MLGLSVTFTLGVHVSPPSSDARMRMFQLMLSSKSRRSYHATTTTPSLFTATTGLTLSEPLTSGSLAGLSSLMICSRDHVLPLSLLYESMILRRPLRKSDHTTYTRSLNCAEPGSTAMSGITAPSERGRFIQ